MARTSQIKGIDKIDSNFKAAKVGEHEVVYRDITEPPFGLTGFPWFAKEKVLCRLPVGTLGTNTWEKVNEGAWHASGGMVRFRTDSPVIAVRVELMWDWDMSHMARTGSAGADLYEGRGPKQRFVSVAFPKANEKTYESLLYVQGDGEGKKMRDWTLNLPLYNGVTRMEVGMSPGAKLQKPAPFTVKKPILFYGGSISQGGCASRPSNSYASILCRRVDAPLINLGFSGCSKLEPYMAELIASLDLTALVIDTTNTSLEEKQARHEAFLLKVRERRPRLPIIVTCRADWKSDPATHRARRAVAMRTWKHAQQRGDKRVLFADMKHAFGKDYDLCTVDGCHPNDLGFMRMADCFDPHIRQAVRLAQR